MEEIVGLDNVKNFCFVDVGGTPAKVLENGKISLLLDAGISSEQLVVVLDPFDLSRAERSFALSNSGAIKRIKFSVPVAINEKISAGCAKSPQAEDVFERFSRDRDENLGAIYVKYGVRLGSREAVAKRYDLLAQNMGILADASLNLREFMDGVVSILSPVSIKFKHLESILSANQEQMYKLLRIRDVGARIFCADCGSVYNDILSKDKLERKACCSDLRTVIQRGSYIPLNGILPVLLYLSGINPSMSNDSPYKDNVFGILKSLKELNRPLFIYSGKSKTMFENYLLQGVEK
jgi:hypothetical protein